jgi:periodic tryptophan protein 2
MENVNVTLLEVNLNVEKQYTRYPHTKFQLDFFSIITRRKMKNRMKSENNSSSRYFTSVCYSADGSSVLSRGNSKYICFYKSSQQILVKTFQVSFNRSLDGILDELNLEYLRKVDQLMWMMMVPMSLVQREVIKRRVEVMTAPVAFSSTGREWAAGSKRGPSLLFSWCQHEI